MAAGLLLGFGLMLLAARWAPAAWAARIGTSLATLSTVFLGIFIEAMPFLLLGTLASGLVEVFVGRDLLARLMPRNPLAGVIFGGLMGLVFPVCECGVVPLTRRLLRKGIPLPVGVAFLLAAPVANPIVIASTIAAFGVGPMLFGRLGISLTIACLTGLVFAAEENPARLFRSAAPLPGGHREHEHGDPTPGSLPARLRQVLRIAGDEFFEMGAYLTAGALLAGLMQTFVPQSLLTGIGSGPLVSPLAMIALAVILSVCSTVDSFVALAFAGTFSPGSILAFLVFGPMVDIKSTLMYLGLFRRRVVGYLILLPLLMTLVASLLVNLYLPWPAGGM